MNGIKSCLRHKENFNIIRQCMYDHYSVFLHDMRRFTLLIISDLISCHVATYNQLIRSYILGNIILRNGTERYMAFFPGTEYFLCMHIASPIIVAPDSNVLI